MDLAGDIFIREIRTGHIRKISAATSVITTTATSAYTASTMDSKGNIYVAVIIRGIQKTDARGATTTLLRMPNRSVNHMAVDKEGNLYLGDSDRNHVYKLFSQTGELIFVVSNTGNAPGHTGVPPVSLSFGSLGAIAVDANGNLFIGCGGGIWRIDAITQRPTQVYKSLSFGGGGYIGALTLDSAGNLYFCKDNFVLRIPPLLWRANNSNAFLGDRNNYSFHYLCISPEFRADLE